MQSAAITAGTAILIVIVQSIEMRICPTAMLRQLLFWRNRK
jgi:hypothetical protein